MPHIVDPTLITELKQYIGFDDEDARRLAALREPLTPHVPAIVDRFYEAIEATPRAAALLTGGLTQIERLKKHLRPWVLRLFSGVYDEEFVQDRTSAGHVHVRIGLSQHYIFGALEVLAQELRRRILISLPEQAFETIESLHKLLAIDAAIMLGSYRDSYVRRERARERNAFRERLSRAEHLAQIGQLAASLAHELKNPLAGISGAIQVIRDSMELDDPHRPVLEEVLRQIRRVDGTVKDLLTYARPKAPRLRTCDVRRLIQHCQATLANEPSYKDIQLQVTMPGPLPTLEVDEIQLEQMLLNLLLNAGQALTDGGTVGVAAQLDGDDLIVVIEDNGPGMDSETLERAFEPFFTTKARGTGLGLPICQRIADMHGGGIQIESTRHVGTRVEVRLPLKSTSDEGHAT